MKLVALALVLAACGDRVDSYAYITSAHAHITRYGDHRVDSCSLVAQLPHGRITTRPANDDTSLLVDPMTVNDSVDDSNGGCSNLLHTWVRVTFPPDEPTSVDFHPPDPGLSFPRIVAIVLALIAVPPLVRYTWRAQKASGKKPESGTS